MNTPCENVLLKTFRWAASKIAVAPPKIKLCPKAIRMNALWQAILPCGVIVIAQKTDQACTYLVIYIIYLNPQGSFKISSNRNNLFRLYPQEKVPLCFIFARLVSRISPFGTSLQN
ncbi:MAG: hypothetical protein JKY92_09205 [Magnetovibrio sp.]|nr:hypothetical protein [Magnetovibrio sp.]